MCKATGAPLLVAMNMDGESASERITKENYRDPKFVALTRSFVCVIGSVFRHNLRDHDEQGRRIPCPRLGEVTCGEHIALEPVLFERYLGGERIAPRHALILADGTKKFDEFLLYDLRELYKKFADAQPTGDPAPRSPYDGSWFKSRNRERLAYEDALWNAKDLGAELDRLTREGDKGSLEALRRLEFLGELSEPRFADGVARVAVALQLAPEYASILRQRPQGLTHTLRPLVIVDGKSKETQTLLLSALALSGEPLQAEARSTLGSVLGGEDLARVEKALFDGGGALDAMKKSGAVRMQRLEPAEPDGRAPADNAALEAELAEADAGVQKDTHDPAAQARFGRASLALARSRVESGFTRDVPFLLQDADHWLGLAAQGPPKDVTLCLDRAETSYRLSDFTAEETHAREALALVPARPDLRSASIKKIADRLATSRELREALRWVGDAAARNVPARAGGDPVAELEGIVRGNQALMLVCLAREASESDWLALASFHGLLGRRELELEFLEVGVLHVPESQALRAALTDACWRGGDLDPLTGTAQLAMSAPTHDGPTTMSHRLESAEGHWYLGVAWIQRAEWARRGERPSDAIREYQGAERAFERCAELKPEFAANCTLQRAACRLGQGFAHLLADERASASQSLIEALKLAPTIQGTRDGLDREPLDLLDGSLEWRASGPSPVDATKLLDALEQATPGNPFWLRALSDSELREARRAQHRNAPTEALLYCEAAIQAARHARTLADDEDSKRAYLLPLSLEAELFLAKDELAPARAPLAEIARELGMAAPEEAGLGFWKDLLAQVRAKLGEAAPVIRPGR